MKHNETSILPCPFCGSEAKKAKSPYGAIVVYSMVECTHCRASVKSYDIDSAVNKWNKRKS